jgi:hypothetical protein
VSRRPADSPLPSSERNDSAEPDLEIASIAELASLFDGDERHVTGGAGGRREERAVSAG